MNLKENLKLEKSGNEPSQKKEEEGGERRRRRGEEEGYYKFETTRHKRKMFELGNCSTELENGRTDKEEFFPQNKVAHSQFWSTITSGNNIKRENGTTLTNAYGRA